VIGYKEFTCKK